MMLYNLHLTSGLVLAPMSGYTNWPMRMLCRRFGAELCYTEMLSAAGMVRRTRNTRTLLERPEADRPLIVQLFTSSAQEACLAARMLEDEGFDGIDINMGCPVKKVVYKGAGAALMKDALTAAEMAESVRNAVRMPVSVKIRAGWDSSSINAPEIAAVLETTGIDCLIVHPRTKADMYRGSPRWEVFSRVREQTRLPLVASGDIQSPEDLSRLRALGADAFMVGRGAVGRPWIFRELTGGAPPSLEERQETMLEHLDMLCACLGQAKGILHMRKYLSAYIRGLPGAAAFRQEVCSEENYTQLQSLINLFFKSKKVC